MSKSKISYLKGAENWNLVTGCKKISSGCKYCWSAEMFNRFNPTKKFSNVQIDTDGLKLVYKWKKSRLVAVCFTSDLFQDDVPSWFIRNVFQVMKMNPQHTFVLLTKRSERMEYLAKELPVSRNVWMGVTVENLDTEYRVSDLVAVRKKFNTWISIEPLLSRIEPNIVKFADWVVVGGESGAKARYMSPEWVRLIRDSCIYHQKPFYFKQWGKQQKGCMLDGNYYLENPLNGD